MEVSTKSRAQIRGEAIAGMVARVRRIKRDKGFNPSALFEIKVVLLQLTAHRCKPRCLR